jgi:hypothetical protein
LYQTVRDPLNCPAEMAHLLKAILGPALMLVAVHARIAETVESQFAVVSQFN